MPFSKPNRHVFAIPGWVFLPLATGLLVCSAISVQRLSGQSAANRTVVDTSATSDDAAKIEWLSKNAVPIRSIDPEDDDFADLMPLKNAFGNAKIVMLGEATHGDGATFYAKQRLVRFLHEAMGFNVIAWELNFFEAEERNVQLASAQSGDIESSWLDSPLTRSNYQYSRATFKTNRPLRHTGLDSRFSTPIEESIAAYRKSLFHFLDVQGSDFIAPSDLQMIRELLDNLQRKQYKPSEKDSVKWQAAIGRVRNDLLKKATTVRNHREFEYFAKTLEDLSAHEQLQFLETSGGMRALFFRSRKLGKNLIWLIRKWYPDQKIIVWAANRHVARNVSSIEMVRSAIQPGMPDIHLPPDYLEMGDFIHRELGNSVYGVAFTTYQGSRGRWRDKPEMIKPIPGTVESLWHQTGQRYGFVDLRTLPADHWLRKPLLALFDQVPERASWPSVFDGMFYIDTMFPDTKSGAVPPGVLTRGR